MDLRRWLRAFIRMLLKDLSPAEEEELLADLERLIPWVRARIRRAFPGISDVDEQEIVEEAIKAVIKGFPTMEDRRKLPGYLRSALLRILRRWGRRWWQRSNPIPEDQRDTKEIDLDAEIEKHQRLAMIWEALEDVDPKKRKVWEDHRVEGMTIKATAEGNGTPEGTTKHWIAEVDNEIKAKLK